ncbi:TIR domain-containing protein [Sphingomonas mesophila]|uniref:TIR domain-containing protein n=1 Tax=Sphingomonas mesophila TaxID=2303576 RepID=UPI0013C35037|nr:TIR domain-containing protein [Sphingomonas mesophila]
MADVFISYASSDRAVAERIARLLGEAGLTTWWDRHIKGGSEFSRDIEEQLDSAAKVLVLWSKEAVKSRWVRDEASVAADSGRLVAATIDGTAAPLGFRQFQTVDLSRSKALPPELLDALDAAPAERRPPAPATSRRPLWLALAAAALLSVAALAWFRPGPIAGWLGGTSEQRRSSAVAIMPFSTPPSSDVAWLGAGLSGALNNSLASLGGLRLVSSTSTQAVAGQRLTAPEIAERLHVSHLVEGDVQKTATGVAIIVRLVEAKSSSQLWSRSYSGALTDLPALQANMAGDLAAALQARLGVAQGNLAANRDVDSRAFEAYLRGVELMSLRADEQKRREALQQFRLAASTAPDFADAHAGLAYLLALSVPQQIELPWPALKAEQRRSAARALKLDPDNLLAEAARLAALHNFDGQVEPVLEGSRKLLARAPDFTPAQYIYANALSFAGHDREALALFDRVVEADPFNKTARMTRMFAQIDVGNYEAVRADALTCDSDCGGMLNAWFEAMLHLATPEQYARDYPELKRRSPNFPAELETLSRKILDAVILGKPFDGNIPVDQADFFLVAAHARLGSTDTAFRLADLAIERFHPDQVLAMIGTRRLGFSAEQRADPRYHALFRNPKLVHMERYRRARGKLEGLPVFPVKPYAGR